MSRRNIVILGSTGSIGKSTLYVIQQHPDRFCIRALAAFSNHELLEKQYHQFRPEYLCLVDKESAEILRQKLKDEPVKVLHGEEEMALLASLSDADIVLNAVVGAAGLQVSLSAVRAGKYLALANKESLVAGGPIFSGLCKRTEAQILPVDSEHSAIWQVLHAGKESEVRRILLTGSGGPFRTLPLEEFSNITSEQALQHPTWNMGPKITIDSATMANKGLEVIEAVVLFSVPPEKVEVVIHPESVIHSMVEFVDSSVIAQLSMPDMRLPITYALFWPERVESAFGRIDWSRMKSLSFSQPDYDKYPALKLAFEVAETAGTAPAVFNAANEVAVDAFLKQTIGFTRIADIIKSVVESSRIEANPELEDILHADQEARRTARILLEKTKC